MNIYCKKCGFVQELDAEQAETYVVWSEHKRTIYPFICECGEVLLNDQDWKGS